MLLIRRFLTAHNGDSERGSALLAVIGIVAVSMIVAVTIVSMSMHSIGYTTSTRATIQAHAAAEAGVDVAAAGLAGSVCASTYSSASAPIYSAVVWYSTAPADPLGGVWTAGCPTSTAATWVKIVSTGTAADSGVAGNSSGNTRAVEAIYPYTPTPPTSGVPVSGSALYSANVLDSTVTNFSVSYVADPQPYIEVLSGGFSCNTPTTINANVVLGPGTTISLSGNCTINGDLYTSGGLTVNGLVKGSLYSDGPTPEIAKGAQINKDVRTVNGAIVNGIVLGTVYSSSTTGTVTGTANGKGSSTVGTVVTAGSAGSVSGLTVTGATIATGQAVPPPVMHTVPPWSDYTYDARHADDPTKFYDNPSNWTWTKPDGTVASFTVKTMTAAECSAAATLATTISSAATPTIFDTRACAGFTTINNLTLQTDVVVIANGLVTPTNTVIKSGVYKQQKKLWLIVPDADASAAGLHVPNCPPANSKMDIGNNTVVQSGDYPVAAMLYSPCAVTNNGFNWNGQLYVASLTSNSGILLTPVGLGLPGQNLDTGDPAPIGFPGTGVLGNRTSMRDLAGG